LHRFAVTGEEEFNHASKGPAMGINSESEIAANLQIGPTSLGMVRIYIAGDGLDLPLDFDPDEAEEIAEELRAAAQAARKIIQSSKDKKR
jgi:phage tail sheath gpL-like